MLSIAPVQLAQVLRTSQQKSNNSSILKRRFMSTDASGSGAPGGNRNNRFSGNRSGSYTYKQAFESTRNAGNLGDQKAGASGKRLNLEDRRKSSQARFPGSNQEGGAGRRSAEGSGGMGGRSSGYGGVRGRTEGGGARMPSESSREPRTAQEVRQARMSIEDRTNKLGNIGRTINLEGDDRILGETKSFEGGGRDGGRGGGRGRGREGFKRADGQGAPRRRAGPPKHMPPPVGSFGLEARAAIEKGGRGGRGGGREGEEEGPLPASTGLNLGYASDAPVRESKKSSWIKRRLAELDRKTDEEEAAEMAGETKKEVKMVDEDLRGLKSFDELDEQGEEKLVQEKRVEEEEIDREAQLASYQMQVAGSLAKQREMRADAPLVELLDSKLKKTAKTWRRGPASTASDVIKTTRDRILDTLSAKPITIQELDEADAMEDIINPDTLETPLELEEEKLIMETQFTFGHQQNDITLHSEKGLIYGIVDMFDRMVVEKKQRLIAKAKKQKRFQIWRAISWPIRAKNIAKRNERTKRLRAEARAKWTQNSQDPNMVYYPSLHLWFSKDELRNDVLRNALSAALSNPSWDRQRRRTFMQGIKADIVKLSSPLTPTKQRVFDSVYNIPKRPQPADSRAVEHLHTLPITDWSLMMAQAERTMDPADRLKRFDPSPYEKKNNVKL